MYIYAPTNCVLGVCCELILVYAGYGEADVAYIMRALPNEKGKGICTLQLSVLT